MIKALISLILGISAILFPTKLMAAERIAFNLLPFGQFYIKIDDLETFVKKGEISDELAYYLNRLPPQQVQRLPELLSTPLELNPLTIAKFSNSTIGETVIENFGKGIRTSTNRNGFFALRGAIIAAAFEAEGLTAMNLLREFPLETIHIDLKVLDQYIERGNNLLKNRELIEATFFSNTSNSNNFESSPNDFSIRGRYTWHKQTLTYNNPRRDRPGYFDLYLPPKNAASLIVISHGVASSRQTFSYLGEHLASHGFAVAIVEHDDISLNKFDGFLSGSERFPEPNNLIDQPLDIKAVLDRLERETQTNNALKNKINVRQTGIIGHSFGGYTSLALGGGQLKADSESAKCLVEDYQNVLLDLSSLAECTFNKLSEVDTRLKEPRIKAVMAINPMAKIFKPTGMAEIDVPTMLISGTDDLMMPPMAEQIQPFSWLQPELEKYLVLVKPGTHFSFLREGLGVLPVPDTVVGISPTFAYPVINSLSTIFFKVYLDRQLEYQKYLRSDYEVALSKDRKFSFANSIIPKSYHLQLLPNNPFELSIIRSISNTQLQKLFNN